MRFEERWEIVRELGKGGQGRVFLALDQFGLKKAHFMDRLYGALKDINTVINNSQIVKKSSEQIWTIIRDMVQVESEDHFGALKVLHRPEDAEDAAKAAQRAAKEISALKEISHPNLITIMDDSLDEGWLVSEYYPRGDLSRNKDAFRGDALKSLKAFRPLVDGVVHLHEKNLFHRDIKPENIFVSRAGDLVLGDFGLTYFVDDEAMRLSATEENVGSRDWMPPWAMGRRIDEINPTFDIYGLGKVLWSMISGEDFLNLWYFKRDEFNLEQQFPDRPDMRLINDLLGRCIVEDEKDCLQSASALLAKIDLLMPMIAQRADLLSMKVERRCKVCGDGRYVLVADGDPERVRDFGLAVVGVQSFKIFTCDYCGHVQLFSRREDTDPPAWKTS